MLIRILKSKIFKSYVISNLIMILIPLSILTSLYYCNLYNRFISEVNNLQQNALGQIQENIEERINSFKITSAQISIDKYVTPYAIHSGNLSRFVAIENIRDYHILNDSFEELMIYYKDINLFISNKGESNENIFLNRIYIPEGNWENESFRKYINDVSTMQFSPPGSWLRSLSSNKRFFVITLPQPIYSKKSYGTLIGLIEWDYFAKLVSNLVTSIDGVAYILNDQNEILFSAHSGYSEADEVILNEVYKINQDGQHVIRINGRSCSFIRKSSGKTQWRYILIYPTKQFQIEFFQNYLFIATVVIIVVSIYIGILIAYHNYKPIRRLNGIILKQKIKAIHDNELENIGQAVKIISEENATLLQQVSKGQVLMAGNLISYLISGAQDINDPEFVYQLESAGITLSDTNYCVIAVSFPRPLKNDEVERMMHGIHNISGEAYCFNVAIKKIIAILLLIKGKKPIHQDCINQLLANINDITDSIPRIGVGKIYPNISMLNKSLYEAIAAVETGEVNNEQTIYFSNIKTWKEIGKYWCPAPTQLCLHQTIRHGNTDTANNTLTELIQDFQLRYSTIDFKTLQFITSCNTARMLQLAEEIGIPLENYDIGKYIHFSSFGEYLLLMKGFYSYMIKYVEDQKKGLKYKQFEEIKSYIDANFNDANMSLSMIADKFSMTVPGLSRFFRKNEGINFSEYLTNLRINAACEILANTDLRVRDVMKQVGYLDLSHFTRRFTQIVGMSPGVYRDSSCGRYRQ